MDSIKEKAAYLKGLADGMNLDESKNETKLFNAIIDAISVIAAEDDKTNEEIELIKASLDETDEHVDAVDEDLADLEEYVYDDECGCCTGCDEDDDDLYEVTCPECGEVFNFYASQLDDEPITCPNCGYVIDEIELSDEEADDDKDE